MSNPESFIDEVSEELRRDRAMQYLRKYGWIAVVVVVLIVGGTAWNEWRKASAQASAEAFGESVLSALENNDTADRIAVLADIEATGAQQGLLQLLRAGELLETDRVAALDALEAAAQDDNLPDAYRQLAALKRVIAGQGVLPLEERQSVVCGSGTSGPALSPARAGTKRLAVIGSRGRSWRYRHSARPAGAVRRIRVPTPARDPTFDRPGCRKPAPRNARAKQDRSLR